MENYFFLLELPFDPPETDVEKIKAAINRKRSQWTLDLDISSKKVEASENLKHLDEIRAVMLENPAARERQADDARKAKKDKQAELEKALALYHEVENTLKEQNLEELMSRFRRFGFTEDEIRQSFEKGRKQEARKFDPREFLEPTVAEAVKKHLKQLQISESNLYDFLGLSSKFSAEFSAGQLCEIARTKGNKIRQKGKKTPNDDVELALCSLCVTIFKDIASKRRYDNYIRLTKYTELNNAADMFARPNRMAITSKMKEVLIDLAVRSRGLSVPEASAYIGDYCAYMGYALPEDKVVCGKCGAENPSESVNCSHCGKPLFVTCPSCGRRCDADAVECRSCGFKLENAGRVTELCGLARRAIDILDLPTAKAHLMDAARLWPNNEDVQDLQVRLSERQKDVGPKLEELRNARGTKQYMKANKLYDAIRNDFREYSDPALLTEINTAINEAQKRCNRAGGLSRDEVLDLCDDAARLCADLPDIQRLRKKYPPDPLTGFSVKTDPHARENRLSWSVSSDRRSVHYIVVRSHTGGVQTVADGKKIFQGSMSSCLDKDIEPGVAYWYNVFADRDGVLSPGSVKGGLEAVNLFEIGPVSVTPENGSLRLSWGAIPRNATVELYISGPRGERRLASTREGNFLITGIPNEVEQRFRVALSYALGGKKAETAGVLVTAAPVCPPAPVDALRIQSTREGSYEAVWRHAGQGEVRIFASVQRPKWRAGTVVPLSTLEREMTALQMQSLSPASAGDLRQGEQGASFRDSGKETLYVTAAALKSGSAVFGPLVRAGKGASVAISDIRTVNGKVHIFLDAPRDASGFAVLYRFDRFPADPSDPEAIRLYRTKEQFALYNAVLLEAPEEQIYYFSVFAWFDQGGEREWSPGANRVFDGSRKTIITYSIVPARGIFGGGAFNMDFRSNMKRFILPDIDVLSAVGAVPLFRDSTSLLYTIPSQEVKGSLKVKIALPKGTPKDTYIRPVLRDEAAQAKNQLRLKIRSSYKIT